MASANDFDFGDNVDYGTFSQILDMDDEDEADSRAFSRSIVFGFLEQAQQTFDKMKTALQAKNLDELAKLGHFLKGSSATLGFNKVKDECEKIQHYGHNKDETGEVDEPNDDKCLRLIGESISQAERAYEAVNTLMKEYYGEA